MILVGNEDIHKSMDKFEFGQDLKSDYGVSCPRVSKKLTSPIFLGSY